MKAVASRRVDVRVGCPPARSLTVDMSALLERHVNGVPG